MADAAIAHNGTERLPLLELEAAMLAPGYRGAKLTRITALDEAERFRRSLKAIRVQLDKKLRRERARNTDWDPDLDLCTSAAKIVEAYSKAVATEQRLRKMTSEDRKGYTPEQLDAVWKHNLMRAAQTMSDEDWSMMIAIRFGENVAKVMLPEVER